MAPPLPLRKPTENRDLIQELRRRCGFGPSIMKTGEMLRKEFGLGDVEETPVAAPAPRLGM